MLVDCFERKLESTAALEQGSVMVFSGSDRLVSSISRSTP